MDRTKTLISGTGRRCEHRLGVSSLATLLALLSLAACDDVSTRTPDVIELGDQTEDVLGPCVIDCDCPQGQACVSGSCTELVDKIYCCDRAACPQGESCVSLEGRQSVCKQCVVACDCPQGQGCVQGSCMGADPPIFCCEKEGCPANQPCVDSNAVSYTCTRQCSVNCDCPQGQLCTASGLCVQGVEPAYCCDRADCPLGETCTDAAGTVSSCRECEHACDCPQGQACSASGICVSSLEPTYCCENVACPAGESCLNADGSSDECKARCGNGLIETGETCDGACPSSCNSADPCINGVLKGSAANCTSVCSWESVTSCTAGDACCPAGCTHETDSDCSSSCGNGVIDDGESCDGNCPSSCSDGNVCTADELTGSAAQCSARCSFTPIVSCRSGDGCCPSGCTWNNDNDCPQITGLVGSPCRNDGECNNGLCLLYWSATGYCSGQCRVSSDCGADAHCGYLDANGDGFCLKTCESVSDCRSPEYGCYDRDGDSGGVTECAPLGIGSGVIGSPCAALTDCQGGDKVGCFVERDYKAGYCTQACGTCPAGSHCVYGNCMKACSLDSQCRSDGYLCYDRNADNIKECAPAGTGNAAVGAACGGVWACSGGVAARCLSPDNGFPRGYCTQDCDLLTAGSCPAGSHCSLSMTLAPISCWKDCNSAADCRALDGYGCWNGAPEFLFELNECYPLE